MLFDRRTHSQRERERERRRRGQPKDCARGMDYFKSRSLALPVQPMDVCALGNHAAVSLIDGRVALASIGELEEKPTIHLWQPHPEGTSCRTATFLDGETLVSGDARGQLRFSDLERSASGGSASGRPQGALFGGGSESESESESEGEGGSAPSDEDDEGPGKGLGGDGATCIARVDDAGRTFAVGFDDGRVEVYDRRAPARTPTSIFADQTDFVSGLEVANSGRELLASSGDGTLALFDLRKQSLAARSEDDADDEMLCVRSMKGGKKVVCGHQSGVLSIFSWGYWNDCSDRFPGHPGSVDAMAKVDEDTLLTGSSDGLIRIVSVLPNKAIGIVGEHLADNPIERLCLEPENRRVALSVSHDNVVKLWHVGELLEDDDDEDEGGEKVSGSDDGEGEGEGAPPARKKHKKGKRKKGGFKTQQQAQRSAFFSDL